MLCALLLVVAIQDLKDVVTVGNEGFMLLPPEIVCAPRVEEAVWAPYGRYVLARRNDLNATPGQIQKALERTGPPPAPQTSVVLWSAQTRQSREIWRAPVNQARVQRIGWFAGTDVAFLIVEFREEATGSALFRIPGSTGKVEPLANSPGEMYFYESPVRPIALIGKVVEATSGGPPVPVGPRTLELVWSVVRSNGELGPALRGSGNAFPNGWSADGKRAYFQLRAPAGKDRWLHLNIDANEITEGAQPRDLVREPPPPVLRLDMGQMRVGEHSVRQLRLAAREGDSKPVLVAGDVGLFAELSPQLDGVLYDTSQTLFVRPVIKLDAAMLRQMSEAAERVRIMSNAKQGVLALIMYASDHAEVFPPPGGVGALIEPYLKNMSIFEGFVYTFPGGDIRKVENPAQAVVGYIAGAGGRAVAYLDGHVQWVPD